MTRTLVTLVAVLAASAAVMAAPAARPDGEALYQRCVICHGRDGHPNPAVGGGKTPDFNDAAWQRARFRDARCR